MREVTASGATCNDGRPAALVGRFPRHVPFEVGLTEACEELMRKAAGLHQRNQVGEAMAAYQSVVARFPKQADAWYNLALLQRQTLQFEQALSSYAKALQAGIARPEEVHLNRSVIFSDVMRDYAAALHELDQALTLNPAFTPALLNLANLHEDFGRRTEASSLYARLLVIEPNNYEALARFANVQPAQNVDPSLAQRIRAALAATADAHDKASLGFALGRLLDAAGRYPEAFAAYAAANQASRAAAGSHAIAYDRARQERFIDRMIEMGTPTTSAATSRAAPQPIFIVGMFRSGSTLTELLLADSPGIAPGGEIDFLPSLTHTRLNPFFETLTSLTGAQLDEFAALYRRELQRVSRDTPYVTDKRPDNFLYLGLIKAMFPDAKIVDTTRDPLDNCLSIFFLHLDQQMSYALDLMDIGHYYRQYRRMMAHWKARFPNDIIDFNYDKLVNDPEPQLQQLCQFLGVEWSGRMAPPGTRSAAIRTASVWQVREPLYRTSSGRARHYASELRELREYLADLKS
jgi:tetratricopeptide (TPR) repeat protein